MTGGKYHKTEQSNCSFPNEIFLTYVICNIEQKLLEFVEFHDLVGVAIEPVSQNWLLNQSNLREKSTFFFSSWPLQIGDVGWCNHF